MSKLVLSILMLALSCVDTAAIEQKQPSLQPELVSIPISFEPNVGQTDRRYSFVATRQGLHAGFRADGVDFEVKGAAGKRVLFPLDFGSTDSSIEGEDPLAGKVNYLLGRDPSRWLRNVRTFRRVSYRNVSRGIDLVFYGNGQEIEHDFVVAPGADPNSIRLTFQSGTKAEVLPDGSVHLQSGDAVLKLTRPVAYQETAQGRKTVTAKFSLSRNSLGFTVGDYDHSIPLTIDPALVYSTFVADAIAPVVGIATDASGNTYLAGYTFSSGLPATGALQPGCSSCPDYPDSFITKLNATGTEAVFSTYLGGSGYDMPVGIKVDPSGNIILAGFTESADFPLKNGTDGSPRNGSGVTFVTSLAPDGASLNYSTMLGRPSTQASVLAMGSDGSAYVAGRTGDSAFPLTSGALRNAAPGTQSPVFVCKVLPDGGLAYSAIAGDPTPQNGGGGLIGVTGLAIDSQGAAYLYGNAGTLWPTTEGAYQTSIPGMNPYAAPFVTKVAPDGSALVYSTFLGSATGIAPSSIAVNSSGEAWVTGAGADATYPTTPDAYYNQSPTQGSWVSYLTRLSADGSQVLYSTYLFDNNSSSTTPTSLAIAPSGNIWIAGSTYDWSFPLIHPLQSSRPQPPYSTGFIAEFDQEARSLLFSSYLGTLSGTKVAGMDIDAAGRVHIGGWSSRDLYTTAGAYLGSVTSTDGEFPFTMLLDPGEDSAAICMTSGNIISFPDTALNSTSTRTVTVKNCGTADGSLLFGRIDSPFALPAAQNGCTSTLAAGASCTFQVNFTPTVESYRQSAPLKVSLSPQGIPASILFNGSGTTPHAGTRANSLQFYSLLLGKSKTQSAWVLNYGSIPLHIDVAGIVVTGDYTINTQACPQTLTTWSPGNTCQIEVTFSPTLAGEKDGTLTVPTDDPAHPTMAFTLTGSAVSEYPVPVLDALNFNTAPLGTTTLGFTVFGSWFFPESTVKVNGIPVTTSYFSNTSLAFMLNAPLLSEMGELEITVANPAPGGESISRKLAVYKSISGRFRHMVYNRTTGLLYVTVPAGVGPDSNTVLIMDPYTGEIRDRIAVGTDPNAIALSLDGRYLYVGADGDHTVQRINTSTKVIEKTYTLPIDWSFGNPETAYQILAVPGSPESFVVVLSAQRSPSSDGLALYNDAGLVNHVGYDYPNYLEVNSATFANDPGIIYILPATPNEYFKTVTVDATGLHYTRSSSFFPEVLFSPVVSDGALLYTGSGLVVDPASKSRLGKFDIPLPTSVFLPDPANRRLFTAGSDVTPYYVGVQSIGAYRVSDYSLLSKLYFDTSVTGFEPRDLARWGRNGLAFISGNDYSINPGAGTAITLLHSSIAEGEANEVPLTIASLSPTQATVNSPDTTTSVSGTGFRYDTLVNWDGTQITPTLVSTSQLTFVVPSSLLRSAGTATVTLSNPRTGGGTASVSFPVNSIPVLSISSSTLDFGPIPVNTSSAAKVITLTNTGTAQLQALNVTTSGDFSQTNNCTSSLAVNASCTVSVVFTPSAAGTRNGSLSIGSNAPDTPQSVALTGSGTGLVISTGNDGAAASVPAGQAANYPLTLTASGAFSGTITLGCTGAPQYATCTVSPSTLELTSGGTATFTVNVSTSQSVSAAARSRVSLILWAMLFVPGLLFLAPRQRHSATGPMLCALLFTVTVIAAGGLSGCGGGASASSTPPSAVTHTVAPGTYTLTITAKAGAIQQSIPLSLTVR